MAKTTYTNGNGKQITAYLTLDSANPQDTTVYLTPNVEGATQHKITWPAVGSKTKPLVQFYDNAGMLKEDLDFSDYWLKAGQEALRNAKFNWFERNFGEARKLKPVEKEKCGGKVKKHEDGSEIKKEACGGKTRKVKKSACGGKSKKLMRSGGKIIEVDF